MFSRLICIWSLLLIYHGECQSSQKVMQRIPVEEIPHYDARGNLEFFPAIVGGEPASAGDFPSHVSIQLRDGSRHICGGTLIDYDFVMTSAHCVVNSVGDIQKPEALKVIGGDISILSTSPSSPNRQTKNVLHVFIHPEYNRFTYINDVALLKTYAFEETPTLAVGIVSNESPVVNESCTLAGWGSAKNGDTKPTPLLFKANVSVTNFSECNKSYSGLLYDSMFCARGKDQDACRGDSGGAMYCEGVKGIKEVKGIVSFGNGCNNPDFPGVYTDSSRYHDFIDDAFRTPIALPSGGDETNSEATTKNPSSSGVQFSAPIVYLLASVLAVMFSIL